MAYSQYGLCVRYEWQEGYMSRPLDSHRQAPLLTLRQTGLLTGLYLPVNVNVPLQGLKVLVVKIRYISPVFKNLRHLISPSLSTYIIVKTCVISMVLTDFG
jgi:hypothetical protein